MDYTGSLTAPRGGKPTSSIRDFSYSKVDAPAFPSHLSHRRSKTEVISNSPPRRTSRASFEDVDLEPEESPGSSRSFTGSSDGGLGGRLPDAEPKVAQSLWSPPRSNKRTPMSSLRQVTSANPFSFFTPKPKEHRRSEVPEPADDELLNLDIDAALFPCGKPDHETDEAFQNLRQNAERVIQQFQGAYKLRTFALHETLAVKQIQHEEQEESAARLKEIKYQLDAMAARVEQQDRQMRALAEELENEKRKRRQENEEWRRNERAGNNETENNAPHRVSDSSSVDMRRLKQTSAGTLSSDSGFESGDESIAESTLSKRNEDHVAAGVAQPSSSNATTPTTPTVLMSPASPVQSNETKPSSTGRVHQSPSRSSAYDRVMKASSGLGSSLTGLMTTSRCSNCYGLSSAEAWSVVSMLKDENKALKNRMSELEDAMEECITLVGG